MSYYHWTSENISLNRGVRQGDLLSLVLFIMFLESLMLQLILNEVIDFFGFVRLQIAYNTRDKSMYTNNRFEIEKLYIDERNQYNNTIRKYLPYYSQDESYKYLGIWINLTLN